MSEQKKPSFFQELDKWIQDSIENLGGIGDEDLYRQELEKFKKAVRAKVLDSYRNGQLAGPRKFQKPQKGGR